MKKIKIARMHIRLLDFTSLFGRDDVIETFVIPSDDDPVVIETSDAERFGRWVKALKDEGCEFEVLS